MNFLTEQEANRWRLPKTPAEQYKEDIRYALSGMDFNYYAVFRPKWSKVNTNNLDKIMQKAIARYNILDFKGSFDYLFYTLEQDRWHNSFHVNMLLKGENINRLQLALSMKRREEDIGYIEPISSRDAVANYVTKHIGKKGLSLGWVGYQVKDEAIHNELFGVLDKDLKHPNEEKHLRLQILKNIQFSLS